MRRLVESPVRRWWWLALAVLATATASRLSVDLPLTPVPQTAQTLAVLAAGIALGSRWGAIAMVLYLGLGALGLPVFAGGAAGIDRILGPTGGFLIGFVLAAAIAGWWVESGRAGSLGRACLGMAIAHAAILATGWVWLATSVGPAAAWSGGISPFLFGAAGKSVLAGVAAALVGGTRQHSLSA